MGRNNNTRNNRGSYYNNQYGTSRTKNSSTPYQAIDESTEGCTRIMQFILFSVVFTGALFSFLTLIDCQFVIYHGAVKEKWDNKTNTNTLKSTSNGNFEVDGSITSSNLIPASFGFFRFTDPDDTEICWFYDAQTEDKLSIQAKTSRWAIFLSTILSSVAMLSILFELCCCRFMCSRFFVTLTLTGAILGLPTSFIVFVDGKRNREHFVFVLVCVCVH